MAARRPGTSRSRFPVRGSMRPLQRIIGPRGDFEFRGQGALVRQRVLADGQRMDSGRAVGGEHLELGKEGRHLRQTGPGPDPGRTG